MAFDATLIVLRADSRRIRAATTGSSTTDESSCSFDTNAIARGVDAARTAGAKVINMSLGGSAMPTALANAIGPRDRRRVSSSSSRRATTAAATSIRSRASRTTTRSHATSSSSQGSVGSGDAISSFSDRAGDAAAHYLGGGRRTRSCARCDRDRLSLVGHVVRRAADFGSDRAAGAGVSQSDRGRRSSTCSIVPRAMPGRRGSTISMATASSI